MEREEFLAPIRKGPQAHQLLRESDVSWTSQQQEISRELMEIVEEAVNGSDPTRPGLRRDILRDVRERIEELERTAPPK